MRARLSRSAEVSLSCSGSPHDRAHRDAPNLGRRASGPGSPRSSARRRRTRRAPIRVPQRAAARDGIAGGIRGAVFQLDAPAPAGDSHWTVWLAERGGRIVGNLWMQLVEKIPNPGPESGCGVSNYSSFYRTETAVWARIESRCYVSRASRRHGVSLADTTQHAALPAYGIEVPRPAAWSCEGNLDERPSGRAPPRRSAAVDRSSAHRPTRGARHVAHSHWGGSVCADVLRGDRQLAMHRRLRTRGSSRSRVPSPISTACLSTDVIVAGDAPARDRIVDDRESSPIESSGLRRKLSLTRDAEALYELGFSTGMATSTYMERRHRRLDPGGATLASIRLARCRTIEEEG